MKRKVVVLVIFLMAASFGSGWLLHAPKPPTPEWELDEAFPPLRTTTDCVIADADEQERFELALRVLNIHGDEINALMIGAQKFLAHGIYRREGEHTVPVCAPADLYHKVGETMARFRMWRGRQTEYGLRLAWRIGQGRPEIVQAVGSVAFSEHPQRSETFRYKDIRPLARAVLARFGRDAAEFRERAFALMSNIDSLGTGAAQVAAATSHPQALDRVQSLMSELLSSVPKDEPIPWNTRNRLYELAYAISFAGDAKQNHLEPILQLMRRKVESWAPPFGMIALRPKRMCSVLEGFSTNELDYVQTFAYCLDKKVPYEQ